MKLIFSRKGFDSASGKMPSPILPDGSLCSLPIPSDDGNIRFSDIQYGDLNLGDAVSQLSKGRIASDSLAHLDPDIRPDSIKRQPGWRPLFGQTGAAQGILEKGTIQKGDIFIFFGWFRQTECIDHHLQFCANAPDRHIIFGWLQIGDSISVKDREKLPEWALYHPHLCRIPSDANDTVYIGSGDLSLPHECLAHKGCGYFHSLSDRLILTMPGKTRSHWKLPLWFYPSDPRKPLGYHAQLDRWSVFEDYLVLKTVGRGQEFVLDCDDYPEAIDWVKDLTA
jgi:hypothetical protein